MISTCDGTGTYYRGCDGYYWSSLLSCNFGSCAYYLYFDSDDYYRFDGYNCCRGRYVRPVSAHGVWLKVKMEM